MAKRIILLLVAGMMVSCIYNKKTSIEDWQAGLKSEHPKIKNILPQADEGFFLSFNELMTIIIHSFLRTPMSIKYNKL